jgi:hypothetical protein
VARYQYIIQAMTGCGARQTYEGQSYDGLDAGHGGLRGWDSGSVCSGECPRYATSYALGCREDRPADESEA